MVTEHLIQIISLSILVIEKKFCKFAKLRILRIPAAYISHFKKNCLVREESDRIIANRQIKTMDYPKRVFVIDDDEDDLLIFKLALDALEHPIEVTHAEDGVTALRRLAAECQALPDLIFLDWKLPKLSCNQVLTGIRKMPEYSAVPIVIYSAASALVDKETLRQLGASYFLLKPASLADLTEELRTLIVHISTNEGR
jgi:CheY-like chemotaxis protein